MSESWKMFVDDIRNPFDNEDWVIARTSFEAISEVKQRGNMPTHLALDHDLGGDDTVMIFLRDLYRFWEEKLGAKKELIPEYTVHSANPIGVENIKSFMNSWKRSVSE